MKKSLLLLFFGIALSTGIMAQTKEIKKDQKELKDAVKDKKEDRHEAAKDLSRLQVKSAIHDRKEVRQHRKSIHMQGKHLKDQGVTHPLNKAKKQVRDDKEIRI